MTSSFPAISVLMPVYNGEKYLKEAIQSILSQSFKDFEFIIVDDGSKDKSWEIIQEYKKIDKRIIPIKNSENLRTSKTLNRGLREINGKYMVRMDADDWSYPDRLEKQFMYMEQNEDIGVSGGTIEICNQNLEVLNKRRYPLTDKEARDIIFRYSPFAHPATIWKTSVIKKAGGYNENIPLSQDYELYFRIGKLAKFGNLPDTILKLRTHQDSSSITRGRYQEQYAIYSRIKAFLELGYDMSTFDKFYTFLQMVSMVLIPPRLKFWIFNFIRRII
jgi:glycosyltransferase involved in cell wall biosynthesis